MSNQAAPSSQPGPIRAGSLREALELRKARGERFSLRESIAIVVPLLAHLKSLHDADERLFVHATAIEVRGVDTELDPDRALLPPEHPRDLAMLPPEHRQKPTPGDAGASVFSVGALLYELTTGESVGPGMRRPSEIVAGLPPALEVVLGKALVGDPSRRPHDLAALAQALHQVAPNASAPPPPADTSHLDHDADFEVDVSLSLMPPAPTPAPAPVQPVPAAGRPVQPASARFAPASAPASSNDPAVRLAQIKQRLESDPRPRYVVVKDGMDHGPFTAVELLQQIASHGFIGTHGLRDDDTGETRTIEQWPDFALFAQQAKLHRDMKQERTALERSVEAEKQSSRWKVLAGVAVLGVLGAGGIGYWSVQRGRQQERTGVIEDKAALVDTDAALSASKPGAGAKGGFKGGGSGSGNGSGSGSFPVVAGGGSCEAAQAKYVEDYSQQGVPPDLSAGAYAGVLNKGSYLNACGVPSNMAVSVCAAVQNGRAVGVTVSTTPSNPGIASCVKSQVMGLAFPSHPRLDVARTTFAAQ
jgi:hypothetical protein